jgi:hypothetical protein
MKTFVNVNKSSTDDDIYYVSAADVADKIIDHMRRGLGPLLLSTSPLAPIPVGPMLTSRLRIKLD